MHSIKKFEKELLKIIIGIKDTKMLKKLLTDLLSPTEFSEIAVRLQIVKRLIRGESQRKIAQDLNIGVATVTRGARELKDKKGGFRLILTK